MRNKARNREAKDNSFKVIFNDPEYFVEFIRDFVDIDLLKEIEPEDIEDISERFIPLYQPGKDSDTVKRINIKGDAPIFVVTILEHESRVNFRTSFKMLQYICLVLDNYEKEAEKKDKGVTKRKSFKYPPILPIVYYDGSGKWTAETNFFDKTELNDVFEKYIPKFEYEVMNLNEYSSDDLMAYEDMLSLILLLDKCMQASDFNKISGDILEYYQKIPLNVNGNNNRILLDITKTLLMHINVPQNEIEEFTDKIHDGRTTAMFEPLKKYDVQETRRVAKAEGRAEGKAEGRAEGKAEGRAEGKAEGKAEGRAEGKAEVAHKLKDLGISTDAIIVATGLSKVAIENL
jgi:hypothetical protein